MCNRQSLLRPFPQGGACRLFISRKGTIVRVGPTSGLAFRAPYTRDNWRTEIHLHVASRFVPVSLPHLPPQLIFALVETESRSPQFERKRIEKTWRSVAASSPALKACTVIRIIWWYLSTESPAGMSEFGLFAHGPEVLYQGIRCIGREEMVFIFDHEGPRCLNPQRLGARWEGFLLLHRIFIRLSTRRFAQESSEVASLCAIGKGQS